MCPGCRTLTLHAQKACVHQYPHGYEVSFVQLGMLQLHCCVGRSQRLPDSTSHEQLTCLVWCGAAQGDMLGNQRHGQGTHTSSNGDVYQGSWHLDQRHGRGRFTTAAGLTYDGEWVEDKAHGWVYYNQGSKGMSNALLCRSLQDTLARYMQQQLRAEISDCLDPTVQCMCNHWEDTVQAPTVLHGQRAPSCTINAACMPYFNECTSKRASMP